MNISERLQEVRVKRPSRVKVLGQWVTVEEVDLSEEDGLWGDSNTGKRHIRIKEGTTDVEYQRVLRHEIFHLRLGISGLSELLTAEQAEALAVLAETL